MLSAMCRMTTNYHLHNEQPPPACDTMYTIELEETSSNETAECVTKLLEEVES